MWYDFVGWIRIEFEIKNTILGSVFIILILSQMEKGVRYFLNELKKFDSVLSSENKRWVEIDEIVFLLCHTGHISWLSAFAKETGRWSFANGVLYLIRQFYNKFNRPVSYFFSLNENSSNESIFFLYKDRLLIKGLLEKGCNNAVYASLLTRQILNELNLRINWSFLQRLELTLKEYPSLLALFISIFWSIIAILIAIFDD